MSSLQTKVRKRNAHPPKADRERLWHEVFETTALEMVGEAGYDNVTVEALLERLGSARATFYKRYESLEQCFDTGYVAILSIVVEQMLERGSRWKDWHDALRAALIELMTVIEAEPAVAKSLLVEVYRAGGAALDAHQDAHARLARALESARMAGSAPSGNGGPAPNGASARTGITVLGGIETILRRHMIAGEPGEIWELLPQLMRFAVLSYGEDPSRAALSRAGGQPSASPT